MSTYEALQWLYLLYAGTILNMMLFFTRGFVQADPAARKVYAWRNAAFVLTLVGGMYVDLTGPHAWDLMTIRYAVASCIFYAALLAARWHAVPE